MSTIMMIKHHSQTSPKSASFAYRHRIALTVLCVLAGLCGTLLTVPDVREATPLDHVCDGLGWSVLIAAIGLRVWSSPYALCRNPQYIGTLLIAISQVLFLKSWCFAMACVFPIVLYVLGVVPAEERLLRRRFGADYSEYCQRVSRWSPQWTSLNLQWGQPENGTAFRHECLRCVWWCLLPLACEFVCGLRELIWSAS